MAMTAKDPDFNAGASPPLFYEKTVKSDEPNDLIEGELTIIPNATPTVVISGADTAAHKFGGFVAEGTAAAGDPVKLFHPMCGKEFGPYVWGPGSADDSLMGDQAYVSDNNTLTTLAVATNDILAGRIIRVVGGKVFIKATQG